MSVFDTWATYVADILQSESQLAASLVRHGGEVGDAREALIKGVLERILPDVYEIGSGEIVDHLGNHSKQIDIVISRKDFPSLALSNGPKVYLIESVLATIEVKSRLNNENLYMALENCASVAELVPNVVAGLLEKLAEKRGLKKIRPGDYIHEDPLETARFTLLGRPATYIYGFKGYKASAEDFAKAIGIWIDDRNKKNVDVAMKHLPAVIATEGCFSWRNAQPYMWPDNILCGVGKDAIPLRIFILHLLYTLSRKIPIIADKDGIIPNLDVYLQQMAPLKFNIGVGKAFNKT